MLFDLLYQGNCDYYEREQSHLKMQEIESGGLKDYDCNDARRQLIAGNHHPHPSLPLEGGGLG